MAAITTGSMSKLLKPGVQSFWGTYKELPKVARQIFDVRRSNMKFEELVELIGLGAARRKYEGQSIAFGTAEQGNTTTFLNLTYGLGFIMTREMIEDNQYPTEGPRRAQSLARSMVVTEETLGAHVLNNAFSSSYLGGDGVCLGSASHINSVDGSLWSNLLSQSTDFSEAGIEQALIEIDAFTDARGLHIKVNPKQLVVPPSKQFMAQKIMTTMTQPFSGNLTKNIIATQNLIPGGVVKWNYLTNSVAWFITTDAPDGLVMFVRRPVEFGADNDWDNENAKYKATMRIVFGWADPRGIFCSAGVQ